MGNLGSDFYFRSPTGLALRQKYVNFESFVNQLYMEVSIINFTRNTLLFGGNIAVGMLKIKNRKGKIIRPIRYVYSSSGINSTNTEPVFDETMIIDTRAELVEVIHSLDSPFALRPKMHKSVFTPLKVNSQNEIGGLGAFYRKADSEYKILEYFSDVINHYCFVDINTIGLPVTYFQEIHVDIYTSLEPCASCKNVAEQFVDRYPSSNVHFYFDKKYRKQR
ncbi:hypothetical protein UP17_25405 (plasmid) [Peribacillus simplex]|uniref:deaminase domain-containing protein n=1 Tax=Peribacillus simplex TaxID=1478 RepID=UPI000777541C|nr:deaminase domain-containing protein [Peribacillus simplex]AMM95774.1 hypothetical protein UP17_25405 [Peribacillus simplex]